MEIKVLKYNSLPESAPGILLIEGKYECYILEEGPHEKKALDESQVPDELNKIKPGKLEGQPVKYLKKYRRGLNKKIPVKDMDGTIGDLDQACWMGRIVMFLRGAQRPIWGYFVGFIDFMVFSKKWDIVGNQQMESAFWVINFLVLGFLFGEQVIKNVVPLVNEMVAKQTRMEKCNDSKNDD